MRYARDTSELSEGAVWCRAFGHGWVTHDAAALDDRTAGWAVTLICPQCGTLKQAQLSQRGDLGAWRYSYPDRYLAKFFIGADERADFRLEVLADRLPGFRVKPRGNRSARRGGRR